MGVQEQIDQLLDPEVMQLFSKEKGEHSRKKWKRFYDTKAGELMRLTKKVTELQRLRQACGAAHAGNAQVATTKGGGLPKLPTAVTKFRLGPGTTEQQIRQSLVIFETEMMAHGTPKMYDGKCRWADGLLTVFEGNELLAGNVEWVRDHLVMAQPPVSWETAKELFVAQFKTAHDQYAMIRPVVMGELTQGEQSVDIYLNEFVKRVSMSIADTERERQWGHSHPVYALLFISHLRAGLRDELVTDPGFKGASESGLTAVAALAARVELKQASAGLFTRKKGQTLGPGAGSSARANVRKGSATLKQVCARCGRTHLGGASACWSPVHVNGQPIRSPPTAEAPAAFKAAQTRRGSSQGVKRSAEVLGGNWTGQAAPAPSSRVRACFVCGDVSHLAKDCPKGRQPARKVARVTLRGHADGGDADRGADQQPCLLCGSREHRSIDCGHLKKAREMLKDE